MVSIKRPVLSNGSPIKHPGLPFYTKIFIKWPGLFQVLRASEVVFEKVSIKQPVYVLSQFQILDALNDEVLYIIESIE